jgi:hypothetical protein
MLIAVLAAFIAAGLFGIAAQVGPSVATTPTTLVVGKSIITKGGEVVSALVLLAGALLLFLLVLLTQGLEARFDQESLLWGIACLLGAAAAFVLPFTSRGAITFDRVQGTVRRGKKVICALKAVRAVLIDEFASGYTGLLFARTGASLLLIYWDMAGAEQRLTLAQRGDMKQLKEEVNDFLQQRFLGFA